MNILIDAQLPPTLASLLIGAGRWLMPLLSEIERLLASGEVLIEVR